MSTRPSRSTSANCWCGELVRAYRLKRAADFLRQGASSSETAYQTGFDSLAYFTKCFRDQYGMIPTEFTRTTGNHQ